MSRGFSSGMQDQQQQQISKDDYHRPRRPDADTLHYLRSLPLDVGLAHEEIQAYIKAQQGRNNESKQEQEEGLVDYPSSLAACLSALDEIKNEIASLAGDEHGATGIETLTRIAVPYSEVAARKLLYYACCSPHLSKDDHQEQGGGTTTSGSGARQSYAVHLALHRYGSHVLQTLLELCIRDATSDTADLGLHEDGPGALSKEEEQSLLPSLSELLLMLQQDLAPHAAQLSVHMCGSHVLRALVCALGGVQMMDARTLQLAASSGGDYSTAAMSFVNPQHGGGKTKRKKKKKGAATGSIGGSTGGSSDYHRSQMFYVSNSRISSEKDDDESNSRQALLQLTHAITGGNNEVKPPGELQQRACHASAAPVLILLLRVLTYMDASDEWKSKLILPTSSSSSREELGKEDKRQQKQQQQSSSSSFANHHLCLMRQEPHFETSSAAHDLAKQLLCWTATDTEDDVDDKTNRPGGKWASDVIYGLSGEPRGSHILDALFRLSPYDFYQSILEAGDFFSASTLKEYMEHDVSNFVVQTLLATIRNPGQAEKMVQAVVPVVSSGLVIRAHKRRRGILWRLAEMAVTHSVGQEQVMQSLQEGLAVISSETSSSSIEGGSSRALEDCARVLLDMKRPDSTESGRLGLNVEGTRALYHLLQFKARHCKPIANSVVALSPSDLELLARDGLGSRCVWDAILEWPRATKNTMQAKVLRKLLDKLNGRWVALATDRIGHHVVRKVFRALGDMNDREKLVQELAKGTHRLRSNAMGRKILEACAVEEYASSSYGGGGADEWRKIVKKRMEKEEWLQEIVDKSSSSGDVGTSNKKRQSSPMESETRKPSKSAKAAGSVNVDSIMEAMSIPAAARNDKKA